MRAPTPAVSISFSFSLLPSHPLLTFPCQAHGFRDLFHGRFKRPTPTISCIERKEGILGDTVSRKHFILIPLVAFGCYEGSPASGKVKKTSYDDKRLLEQNRRIQAANNAPTGFPNFIREGFQVKVATAEQYVTTDSGLIYLDVVVGKGDCPKPSQQVGPSTFFSSKQFEVFDVELLSVQNCQRRTI